jgi:IclR family transcriptional regulator, acetate operon repressor
VLAEIEALGLELLEVELLELLADSDGALSLSQLSSSSGLPLATIHRLMGTLVRTGYVRRGGSRRYVPGPRLIHLGETASQMLGSWARRHLAELLELTGETANLAILEGDTVVYLAQVPGRHSMRMFTEPGRWLDPHCTAVGKAILAQLPEPQVRDMLARTGMTASRVNTITARSTRPSRRSH